MAKAKKPYKNSFFLKVVIQKCEKSKKWIFSKNWLTLFVSVREKKRAFSCTLSVLAKIFFGPKTVQTRKNYKNSGFSGNCPKPKMTPFFGKRVFFLTWVKKWVLLTVFFKSCVSWKHYFYSGFSKTQLFKNKNCMLKKTENIWKIVGCFWTWQNGVFWVCFFWGFSVIVVCFWCVWHSSRSVKNACFFPVFWAFVGWLILAYFGFGRFRCFCVSCVCFCFLCCFCFCFVCFVFVLLLDWFWCWFLFCFCFCYFLFFFFFYSCFVFVFVVFCFFVVLFLLEGWPPHLALNPPCFLFLFFFVFCFFVFCFFWRV